MTRGQRQPTAPDSLKPPRGRTTPLDGWAVDGGDGSEAAAEAFRPG
jgi:hypothetical protein